MALDKLATFGRAFIISLNSFFLLLALGVAVLGAMIMFMPDLTNEIFGKMISMLADMTGGMGGVDLSTFDLKSTIGNTDMGLFIGGMGLIGVCLSGIFGSQKKIYGLLVLYGILLLLIVVSEAVAGFFFTKSSAQISDYIRNTLQNLLISQYFGANNTDIVTVAMNFLMVNLDCCGINGFHDFNQSESWYKSRSGDGSNFTFTLVTPLACCKDQLTMNNSWDAPDCALYPSGENSNYQQGCFDLLLNLIGQYVGVVYGLVSAVGLIELVLLFLAFWLAKAAKKEQKEKKEKEEKERGDETSNITESTDTDQESCSTTDKKKQKDSKKARKKNNESLSTIATLLSQLHTEGNITSPQPTLQSTVPQGVPFVGGVSAVQVLPGPSMSPFQYTVMPQPQNAMYGYPTPQQPSCFGCGTFHAGYNGNFNQTFPVLNPVYLPTCPPHGNPTCCGNEKPLLTCSHGNGTSLPPPYPGRCHENPCQYRNELQCSRHNTASVHTSTDSIVEEPILLEQVEPSIVSTRSPPHSPQSPTDGLHFRFDFTPKTVRRSSLYDRRGSSEQNRPSPQSCPDHAQATGSKDGQRDQRVIVIQSKARGRRPVLDSAFRSRSLSGSMYEMLSPDCRQETPKTKRQYTSVRL